MKIANSTVNLAAASNVTQSTVKQTSMQFWVGDRSKGTLRQYSDGAQDRADITATARKLALTARFEASSQTDSTQKTDGKGTDDLNLSAKDKQNIQIIDDFLYRLTGKHIQIHTIDKAKIENAIKAREASQQQLPAEHVTITQQAPQKAGYGVIVDYSEIHTEKQEMTFQADGVVQTEDGRTIDFSVELSMSREFQSANELHLRAGDAKIDPLVINVDGGGPQLSQRDFKFDLDNDGDEEQISRLLPGSGFLALDKNEDGVINNGGELFGPTEGNGFAELKAYDTDGNNWIDENDAIFDKLRIWMADDNGDMQLFALGQKGVGALYLGNVASSFDIKDFGNDTLGTVQSTGIFLKENGGAGTLQHIDLTV
jgi:hypothetical protein